MGHTMIKRALGIRLSTLSVVIALGGCGKEADLNIPISDLGTPTSDHWYPIPKTTPGALCTRSNPDFDEVRYAEKIPHCARNVSHATKVAVSVPYGVSEEELKNYQVDHLIPLALGGSNAPLNLWPVPYTAARNKAKFEFVTYNELKDGKISQKEAIAKIHSWVQDNLKKSIVSDSY